MGRVVTLGRKTTTKHKSVVTHWSQVGRAGPDVDRTRPGLCQVWLACDQILENSADFGPTLELASPDFAPEPGAPSTPAPPTTPQPSTISAPWARPQATAYRRDTVFQYHDLALILSSFPTSSHRAHRAAERLAVRGRARTQAPCPPTPLPEAPPRPASPPRTGGPHAHVSARHRCAKLFRNDCAALRK